MKAIKYIGLALCLVCRCITVNVFAEDHYYPDARFYYTFDADSMDCDNKGNYIIADFSPYEFDITVPKENVILKNDCISGSFTIPVEAFSDITDFTLNFWYEADPEKYGYASQAIIEFGEIMLTGLTGSGFIRLCTYFENRSTVYAPGLTADIDVDRPNMYTLIKSNDTMHMYLNGQTIKSRILGNYVSTVNFSDIAASGAEFKVSGYMIDEFSFYNTALTGEEINSLYEKTSVKIEEAFAEQKPSEAPVAVPTDIPVSYPYEITNLQLIDIKGEPINEVPLNTSFIIEAEIKKAAERNKTDYFIAAVYGRDGELFDLEYVKADFSVNGTCSFRFDLPAQSKEIGSINTYVWNSFSDMTPLAAPYNPIGIR